MFVDPMGTDAYLFIGLDQADRADAEKAELEKKYGEGKVHVRIIKNRGDFQKAWNGMGNVNGQEVPIELAEIHMHGESGYIEDVDMKELKNDRTVEILVLSSCNTGHLDVENNVAVQFLNQQNVNMVIAPDGTHYKAKLGGNLRIKVWSDPNYDTSFSKDLKKMRENQGMVKFTKNQDGTISKKILGREFENINELLAKATSDESMTGIISLHEWYHIQRTLLTPPLIVGGIVLWKH